jgi:ATP-dependent Lhr-like helicase
VLREDLADWASLAPADGVREPSENGREIGEALERRGAMFFQELVRVTGHSSALVEEALTELIALARVTCDSFAGLRWLIVPASRRRATGLAAGRWSLLPREPGSKSAPEFVARRLLMRTGVVFRKTVAREKLPVPWRDIARVLRSWEARGEVRGGRFVGGFDGEQYALPEAVTLLRELRRRGDGAAVSVSAADPLNFRGILTPDDRVAPTLLRQVKVG